MARTIVIIQARMSSSRLPGKVLAGIAGKPAIAWTIDRARRAEGIDGVWVACSDVPADDPLAEFVESKDVDVYRGDEEDVLSRFAAIAAESGADRIVRLTGDCPFADPEIIACAIETHRESGADYVSNHLVRSYPDGLDVEVFSRQALDRTHAGATDPFLRQHVTPYIHGRLRDRLPWGDFTTGSFVHPTDFSHLRWTLDEPEDLLLLNRLADRLPEDFHWLEGVAAMTRDPGLLWINRKFKLNEGTARDLDGQRNSPPSFARSDALFSRASETIPLASQTFSKSYQQWVKGAAPLFLTGGKGCRVRDPDGNEYIDYLQGLMANILGYADPDVDEAVRVQLESGVSFSLPTPLETDLAERLVNDIPCADMVRFGKNGSDATSGAIRLARAWTGREKVALCGYHGWHDWYIGTTARDLGVPGPVKHLSSTFGFNDAEALEDLLKFDPDGYAAVILEPDGVAPPAPGFLTRLRELTSRHGVVLVFDEIVTGFRMHPGGAQAYHGVTPDLACFGKAMANGLPISAVVGRREIMQKMEDIFFSGTFGGEALSLAGAIATIDKLKRESAAERLWRRGDALIRESNAAISKHGLDGVLAFGGSGWWPRLTIHEPPVDPIIMTSLLRQEFVGSGLLLASSFNLCLPHDTDAVMNETISRVDDALWRVADHLDAPDPASRLRGDLVRPTFSVR